VGVDDGDALVFLCGAFLAPSVGVCVFEPRSGPTDVAFLLWGTHLGMSCCWEYLLPPLVYTRFVLLAL